MLLTRVLASIVLVPILVAAVCAGGLWFTGAICVLAFLGMHEFSDKCRRQGIRMLEPIAQVAAIGLVLLVYARTAPESALFSVHASVFGGGLLGLIGALVGSTLIYYVWRFHRDQTIHVLVEASVTVFAALYVGIPFAFFPLVRALGPEFPHVAARGLPNFPLELGAGLLLVVFCAIWANDTAAYFIGRWLGKHPLSPVSPKKTVEGAIGGMVGSVAASLLVGYLLQIPIHLVLPQGILIGVAGQLGDLMKSVLKRDLETKDFGSLIPGHGGILDRFDSLMLAVPISYFCAWVLL
jgi:phosphatidate cytidylyltransferase